MSRLFNRKAVITVQTRGASTSTTSGATTTTTSPALEVACGKDGFDCRFDIHKDLTGKPNRATIDIFNLKPENRDALSERAAKGPVRVRVEAGYEDNIARIFEGDLRILYHKLDRADWTTRIETGDGDHIVSTARVSRSWGPGTAVSTIIKDLAGLLDIGEGNVRTSTAGALLEGWGATYTGGTVASGRIFQELTRICRSAGLEWSIQDGTLQFLVTDKALSSTAVLLTSATGMEGSATIDHKHKLHVKMRMIPMVHPGRKIQLEDKSIWRVDKAHYQGNTRGEAWGITVQGTHVD